MEDIIKQIILQNKSLFGDVPQVHKIDIGFTNTLYNVNLIISFIKMVKLN